MTGKRILSLAMLVFALCLLMPSAALANSISLSFTNPVQAAAPGATITFEATVSASITNAAPIFLNSDEYNVAGSLTLDDSGFFAFPLSLNPGDSYTGVLFTVTLPGNVAFGNYTGSFGILGGADGAALNNLTSTGFQVNVTPEPSPMLLSATGAGMLAFVVYRRKQISLGHLAVRS